LASISTASLVCTTLGSCPTEEAPDLAWISCLLIVSSGLQDVADSNMCMKRQDAVHHVNFVSRRPRRCTTPPLEHRIEEASLDAHLTIIGCSTLMHKSMVRLRQVLSSTREIGNKSRNRSVGKNIFELMPFRNSETRSLFMILIYIRKNRVQFHLYYAVIEKVSLFNS
jgi:hypothetical protein